MKLFAQGIIIMSVAAAPQPPPRKIFREEIEIFKVIQEGTYYNEKIGKILLNPDLVLKDANPLLKMKNIFKDWITRTFPNGLYKMYWNEKENNQLRNSLMCHFNIVSQTQKKCVKVVFNLRDRDLLFVARNFKEEWQKYDERGSVLVSSHVSLPDGLSRCASCHGILEM